MEPQEIINRTIEFINNRDDSETSFNEQALHLFAYQFRVNQPYQQFCRQQGKTVRTVKSWRDIPAIPINAFKELTLSCEDPSQVERIFMTSGTTQGVKGNHYHPTLQVYDRSMIRNFKERFMNRTSSIRMGVLFPTEEEMPNSSLAHYLALAVQEFGAEGSRYFIGQEGVQVGPLIEALEKSENTGQPYALMGATYSFIHLFDELERCGRRFSLPKGSKLLDTGGFKNQARVMTLDGFYDLMHHYLGVPHSACINMYGMTELSSQFYDTGNENVPSVKSGPHWTRTKVMNPLTGEEVPQGERGILAHCDLANFNSVSTILTEDVGVETEDGFLLLGRAEGAAAKGCSINVEEFIKATKGLSE
ncbi:long-chain fatty acid--CoA ligase [Halobacillus seohaensis]|uniref:Long-chain fatty acid--CoA ligase n=1 Tax=Halobacillus seohaensis TaxID=447421 RepID=A0ABW2EGG2_9BACI